MNRKSLALAISSIATVAVLAGCSSTEAETTASPESTQASGGASSETDLTVGQSFPVNEDGCAFIQEDSSMVEVSADVNCVLTTQGSMTLLYSLARDDISDSRLDVVSGDKETAVPLVSPEVDGAFLMGFVSDKVGKSTVDVYVTTSAGEEKVQTIEVDVLPRVEVANSGEGMTFNLSSGTTDSSTLIEDWVDTDTP